MSRPIYVGIDPGLSGYIAAVSTEGNVETWAMPILSSGARGKKVLDALALLRLFNFLNPNVELAVIEQQGVLPGQGSVSGFKTGYGYGMLVGLMTAEGIPYEEVRPASWKKRMDIPKGLTPKATKTNAIRRCMSLYPGVDLRANSRCRVPHDGKAEAILLAEYARRRHAGKL